MAASPPTAGESFARPPLSFVDGDDRRIAIEATDGDDAFDDLAAMYDDFADEDLSQGVPPRDERRRHEWIEGLLTDGVNVLARHEDSVVGHAILVPFDDRSELAIFVHQDYQHAGVGSKLIRALLGEGEAADIDRVWLCVERSNDVAINLYRSVGFETTIDRMELEMELEFGDGAETGEGS
jgi:ribosomal protein S18 acetylase RimI-like enzyme